MEEPVTTEEPVSIRESIPENVVLPITDNDPVISTEPVNWCLSSNELPNLVEPLSKIIDADTNSV